MKSFCLALFLMPILLAAQLKDSTYNHTTLTSKGSIPKEFTDLFSKKYERQLSNISQQDKRKIRRTQDDFYLQNEYYVNRLLMSGDVLFGDTVTQYCNKIVDLLLTNNPALRKDIRVYLVKSPQVNAFATGNGSIFINMGLVAQVENEAQLASVLAHEIIHYEERHVLNEYVEANKDDYGFNLFKTTDEEERIAAMSSYSKELEFEADEEGFKRYYTKAGYSMEEAYLVMDILMYSYLPFDEIKFDPSFIETKGFKFPESYIKESVASITAEADYDDSLSTHPNIKKRKENFKSLITELGGSKYKISESWFKHCQKTARYECTALYLQYRDYPEAIYDAYLLKHHYGSDKFQDFVVSTALTNASIYDNDARYTDITARTSRIEGESQQVYHLIGKLKKEQLNILATTYTFESHQKYPEDEQLNGLFRTNMQNLVQDNELVKDDFKKTISVADDSTASTNSILDSLLANNEGRSSKIRNINRKKAEEVIEQTEEEFAYYAFSPYLNNEEFLSTLEEFEEEYEKDKTGISERLQNQRTYSKKSKYKKNKALAIDKIVCLTPLYLEAKQKSYGIQLDFLDSEVGQFAYVYDLKNCAEKLDLDLELLNIKAIESQNTEVYNDMALLQNWVYERLQHENTRAVVSSTNTVDYIRDKYNTDYVSYTGNFSLFMPERNIVFRLLGSIVFYPALPVTLYNLATPDYESASFFFLFDLKTGDILIADFIEYETADRKDYRRALLYNYLLQVKHQN